VVKRMTLHAVIFRGMRLGLGLVRDSTGVVIR